MFMDFSKSQDATREHKDARIPGYELEMIRVFP